MINILFLDIETSFKIKSSVSSPFFGQKLVSVGYTLQEGENNELQKLTYNYLFFDHNHTEPSTNGFEILQRVLEKADILVGHNIKFDLQWLRECGFTYRGALYDTMVGEYLLSRGRKVLLSLDESCKRHAIQGKKVQDINKFIQNDISFEDMPWEVVKEYGQNDVKITKELAEKQLGILELSWKTYLYGDKFDCNLLPVLKLSNQMTNVLTDIERTGIKVSNENLKRIKNNYEIEYFNLELDLNKIIEEVMGDTPINLDSPDDRSMLFYSRKVCDKKEWKRVFNLGWEVRGSSKKPKRRPRMNRTVFVENVKHLALVQHKTTGSQCSHCRGYGKISFTTKLGKESKTKRVCKICFGKGVLYTKETSVAGLKIKPRDHHDTSTAGFKTDKFTLEQLLLSLDGVAKEFVEKYIRYSQIKTYLNTFVNALESFQDENNFIHPQFMQCVTATGRLSSRSPNFQNMPRGTTFPAREAIVSRFDGGYILEGDYRQLEFRIAGYLSGDTQIYKDVEEGIDVHSYTASVMNVDRQTAKAHTFKPLYGGVLGTPQEMKYYNAFKTKYSGIADWHQKLQREAVVNKKVVLPSGREYSFPEATFTRSGTATGATAIKNYPVQGFATADILPLALIDLKSKLDNMNVKSVIVNTVHDSIILDVYPEEKELIITALKNSMLCIKEECEKRFNINFNMPIDIELKIGHDWLNLKEMDID